MINEAVPPLKMFKKKRQSNSMAEQNLKGMVATKEYISSNVYLPTLVNKQGVKELEKVIKHA